MSFTASVVSLITGLGYAARFLALREEIKLRTLLTSELDANEKRATELRKEVTRLRASNLDADADSLLRNEARNAALRNRISARLSLLEKWADDLDKSWPISSEGRPEVGKSESDKREG